MRPYSNSNSPLDYSKAQEIRAYFESGEKKTDIARAFGVTWHAVHNIVNNRTFASPIPVPKELISATTRERKRRASRRWADRNRSIANLRSSVITSGKRAGGGDLTAEEWLAILESFDHRCAYCGARDKLTIDHVTPISRGGQHSADNVVPACGSCNFVKGRRGPLFMVSRNFGLRAA